MVTGVVGKGGCVVSELAVGGAYCVAWAAAEHFLAGV